ncbi:hypothetical protein [Bradyrhizobium sp. ARR65]|uniref:hypothetical protein n=1 Tax=Bradyrhizobium sp. ARR65 TaxID=1040989 RepID=UPI00046395AC|nr:hypothetical protein [Bradyrhizobium sp. ARR65]
MMFAVVYLSELGQVSGKVLFQVIREKCPGRLLSPTLPRVLIRNDDLGGQGGGRSPIFIPLPLPLIVIGIAAAILRPVDLGLPGTHPPCSAA